MRKGLPVIAAALAAAVFLMSCAPSGDSDGLAERQETAQETEKEAARETEKENRQGTAAEAEREDLQETAWETEKGNRQETAQDADEDRQESAAGTAEELHETAQESEREASGAAEQEKSTTPRAKNAARLLADMGVGWNLGNTFDAHGAPDPAADETYWGNPATTKEMIDAVRLQGFRTLRLPVTWSEHVGGAPDHAIDRDWLERVAEVVDYAYGEGMYVILDTHHEPDYWLKPQKDGLEKTEEELCAVWRQLAERFADHGERLLFEGMNEPRVKGSPEEWSGGTQEGREAVNRLNAAFVRTVRACGGNNASRCLILCPYGNSVTAQTLGELEIPADDENIAVAVHMYTPYFFAFDPGQDSVSEWTPALKGELSANMKLLDRYLIDRGVPVIITEFGAVRKTCRDADGTERENTDQVLAWLADYMEMAGQRGIPCIWWDNGIYDADGEKFGIFDRRSLTWYAPKIADALVENAAKLTAD